MRPTLPGAALALAIAAASFAQSDPFANWESPQSHPIELTPNGQVLVAVNTADARLEVFDLAGGVPVRRGSVQVGLDPVSVRALAKGMRDGQPRGWVLQAGTFASARVGESISPAALLASGDLASSDSRGTIHGLLC